MQSSEDFKFFMEAEISKGGSSEHEMVVEGIASTDARDRQGEILHPVGFDFNPFLEYGLINYHHQTNKMPLAVIGEPIEARVTDKGQFYVKGFLYPSNPVAKQTYKQMEVFEKDSKKRRMGWSVEGKPKAKDPSDPTSVLKAMINNVALTPLPINGTTYAQIMKGFAGDYEVENEETEKGGHQKGENVNGGEINIVDININGNVIKMSKKGELYVKLDKAIDTNAGRALIRESLEDGAKLPITKKTLTKAIMSKQKFTNFHDFEKVYYKVLDKLRENRKS